jgi:hypothetical protein
VDAAERVAARVGHEERLAAPVGWHWSLLLDRPVYSLSFAARRAATAGVDEVIQRRKIDRVLFRTDPPDAPRMLEYLESRFGVGERIGSTTSVKVSH